METDPYEDLRRNVNQLKALLDDPQPGLFTWHGFCVERMQFIADELAGKHSKKNENRK